MGNLVIKLRPGDTFIVNGVPLRALTRAQVEVAANADILFGRWVFSAEDATTPLRQAYFALQCAYVEQGAARERHAYHASSLVESAALSATDEARHALAAVAVDIRLGRFARALRTLRPLIRQEEREAADSVPGAAHEISA